MGPVNPAFVKAAGKAAKKIVTAVGPDAVKHVVKYQKGNHGSKVKRGAYQDCKVEMFGDKACIVTDPDSGEVVFLTSDFIESCRFIEEKFKKARMKTYYYYEIVFKDGQQSYVRMSSKYRDAMENYL